jgi:hypothetical protein
LLGDELTQARRQLAQLSRGKQLEQALAALGGPVRSAGPGARAIFAQPEAEAVAEDSAVGLVDELLEMLVNEHDQAVFVGTRPPQPSRRFDPLFEKENQDAGEVVVSADAGDELDASSQFVALGRYERQSASKAEAEQANFGISHQGPLFGEPARGLGDHVDTLRGDAIVREVAQLGRQHDSTGAGKPACERNQAGFVDTSIVDPMCNHEPGAGRGSCDAIEPRAEQTARGGQDQLGLLQRCSCIALSGRRGGLAQRKQQPCRAHAPRHGFGTGNREQHRRGEQEGKQATETAHPPKV